MAKKEKDSETDFGSLELRIMELEETAKKQAETLEAIQRSLAALVEQCKAFRR